VPARKDAKVVLQGEDLVPARSAARRVGEAHRVRRGPEHHDVDEVVEAVDPVGHKQRVGGVEVALRRHASVPSDLLDEVRLALPLVECLRILDAVQLRPGWAAPQDGLGHPCHGVRGGRGDLEPVLA
jgi:hypothetical protein